jgi:tricorn protease
MSRLLLTLCTLLPLATLAGEARLLRFADIHHDQVAFVHAGDIYVAPSTGGPATRITSHEGLELFPKFSPDGKQIAFSAEYNGTRQVYVMPTTGGEPRQLTWYNDVGPMPPRGGYDNRVMDWTPDGKNVLVRANRLPWGVRMGRPYLVPVDGGMEQAMSVPETGGGMLSPDGNTLVYTPIDREFRTWKRYRGGRAQDVWTYDLKKNTARQLTDHPGTDNQPVWVGDQIYFASDRDFKLNLYRWVEGGEVLWPSAGPTAVVYEAGGYLYRFDPESAQSNRIDITIEGDWPQTRPRFENVSRWVESWDLSPKGKRALFGARGELFTAPAKDGEVRNISRSPAAREISASWSPDGRWIAYLSDATGEYEIYVREQNGSELVRQITKDSNTWLFEPRWSPDGAKLAYADKNQRLKVVDVEGKVVEVDHSTRNDITDFAWAPDSRHMAYVKTNAAGLGDIWVHDLDNGQSQRLTNPDTNDINPAFDRKGRYLYFLSNRDYNLTFSDYEFNYLYTDATRVYAGQLSADGPALFTFRSDEVQTKDKGEKDGDKKDDKKGDKESDKKDDEKVTVKIDVAGFSDRVLALMDDGGNYRSLLANNDGVYYLSGQGPDTELKFFGLKDEETLSIMKGLNDYRLSADGTKIMFAVNGNKWGIADAKPKQDAKKGLLDLDHMELRIDPRVEWQQMYVDGWRVLRDWFYDPGMHGQDWNQIRQRYAPLVAHVNHRGDLDYVFSELAGEMQAGHIYVQTGDQPQVERQAGGLLGAELKPHKSGYFSIARIFRGENWHDAFRSPLSQPGVDVDEGDYLLAVNGVSAKDVSNAYALLENTAGRVITLTVNDKPARDGARQVRVKTISGETNLRYLDWVRERRKRVDELSGGRIGYIHLPNTAQPGNRELFKTFLPQANKDALIIDDRYNGGGFIPDRMIELLSRRTLNYWKRRGLDPQATPLFAHDGPKVMLINGYSSSGGDALPYYFNKLGLGKLIGTRTWGGLIGISGNPGLADGGLILASTFRFLDTDGNWAVENEGVSPDIEVLDRPDDVAAGRDPSLERAVEELLRQLEENPPQAVTVPPAPTDFR